MRDVLLRCDALGKSFDGKSVFASVSLELSPGAYVLQGANGIGKSTLLRLLAGAQRPEFGEVWIDGVSLFKAPVQARRGLSYVPAESPVYPFMTGSELLEFVAAVKKCPIDRRTDEMVESFGVMPHSDIRFGAMSSGTQKKFLLAAAWIGDPRVLLFDEPDDNLDLAAREYLASRIRASAEHDVVLFASHDIAFVRESNATVISMEQLVATGSRAAATQDVAIL
ncbi:MAG: ABC transporter ATP-binding protein [Gammaproteobacteria bacterium]